MQMTTTMRTMTTRAMTTTTESPRQPDRGGLADPPVPYALA